MVPCSALRAPPWIPPPWVCKHLVHILAYTFIRFIPDESNSWKQKAGILVNVLFFYWLRKTSKGGGRLPRRSVPDLVAASFWGRCAGTGPSIWNCCTGEEPSIWNVFHRCGTVYLELLHRCGTVYLELLHRWGTVYLERGPPLWDRLSGTVAPVLDRLSEECPLGWWSSLGRTLKGRPTKPTNKHYGRTRTKVVLNMSL